MIPKDATKIASKSKHVNYLLFGLCVFFPLVALCAIFGFCTSIRLDFEYDFITAETAALYHFLTHFISLTISAPFVIIAIVYFTKVRTNKCTDIYVDDQYLYFSYGYSKSTAIPLVKIIGYDDNEEYTKTINDLGCKKGLISTIKSALKIMTIRYEEDGKIKKIDAIVDAAKDVEFLIAEAVSKARGNEFYNELNIQGVRMEMLHPGYMIIAIVLTLGFLFLFWMLFGFEIHDYMFDLEMHWREPGEINIGVLVTYALCSLLGFPLLFVVIKGYSNFRHLPYALIAYNAQTEKVYLYKHKKYIVIDKRDIISAKGRNERERHIDKTYIRKNYQTGMYESYSTYKNVVVPRGTITITYKDNNGKHKYKVHVRRIADVTLGGIVE